MNQHFITKTDALYQLAHYTVEVRFGGKWGIRTWCVDVTGAHPRSMSLTEAKQVLRRTKSRCSWPVRLVKAVQP